MQSQFISISGSLARFPIRSNLTLRQLVTQLLCLTISDKKGQSEALTMCGRQMGKRQFESKTKRPLRYLWPSKLNEEIKHVIITNFTTIEKYRRVEKERAII